MKIEDCRLGMPVHYHSPSDWGYIRAVDMAKNLIRVFHVSLLEPAEEEWDPQYFTPIAGKAYENQVLYLANAPAAPIPEETNALFTFFQTPLSDNTCICGAPKPCKYHS